MKTTSATQIDNFLRCNRKWFFESVLRVGTPPFEAMELGTQVHGEMERYYLTGQLPDYASARRLIEHTPVPARGPNVLIEYPANRDLRLAISGVPLRGKIDLVDLTPNAEETAHIVDWKTVKWPQYRKTGEDLLTNLQTNIYAWWLLEKYPAFRYVKMSHGSIYTQEVGCDFATSDAVDRRHVDNVLGRLPEITEKMKCESTVNEWEDVEPTLDACNSFGGCPFRGVCGKRYDLLEYKKRLDAGLKGDELVAAPSAFTETTPPPNPHPNASKEPNVSTTHTSLAELVKRAQTKTATIAYAPLPDSNNTAPAPAPDPVAHLLPAPPIVPPGSPEPKYVPTPVERIHTLEEKMNKLSEALGKLTDSYVELMEVMEGRKDIKTEKKRKAKNVAVLQEIIDATESEEVT